MSFCVFGFACWVRLFRDMFNEAKQKKLDRKLRQWRKENYKSVKNFESVDCPYVLYPEHGGWYWAPRTGHSVPRGPFTNRELAEAEAIDFYLRKESK